MPIPDTDCKRNLVRKRVMIVLIVKDLDFSSEFFIETYSLFFFSVRTPGDFLNEF